MSGPANTHTYLVRQGDCILSIAADAGLPPDTIWDDNSGLETDGRKPHALLPGDSVQIRELEQKTDPGATNTRHRFRLQGDPVMLKIRVLDMDEPLGGFDWTLDIAGQELGGTTDGDGVLETEIPPSERTGKLVVEKNGRQLSFDLDIGAIDPIATVSGVQGRLYNLGYDPGPFDGVMGPRTASAIRQFQDHHDLDPSGEADDALKQELESDYGG